MNSLRLLLATSVLLVAPVLADTGISEDQRDPKPLIVEDLGDFLHLPGILAWVEMPKTAELGETIKIRLTVVNAREDESMLLESIDIGGSFLYGFEIRSIDPVPHEADPAGGILTLFYPPDFAPGQERVFEFELVAAKAGVFIGDIDVWESGNFLTRAIQCTVTDPLDE